MHQTVILLVLVGQLLLVTFGCGPSNSPPLSTSNDYLIKQEMEKFQGTWDWVSNIDDGSVGEGVGQWSFTGDKFRVGEEFGTFRLDPNTKPKQIDLFHHNEFDPQKPIVVPAVYEIADDELKICVYLAAVLDENVTKRPPDLASPRGEKRVLQILRRAKK